LQHNGVRSNFSKTSGKWYWEITIDVGTTHFIGIGTSDANLNGAVGSDEYGYAYHDLDGKAYNNSIPFTFGDTYEVGDIIGVAMDLNSNKLWFSKNGVWQDSGDPEAGTYAAYDIANGTYYAMWSGYDGGEVTANFGNSAFAYDIPAQFSAFAQGLATVTWDDDNVGSQIEIHPTIKVRALTDLVFPTCAAGSYSTFLYGSTLATISKSTGKWYWEVVVTAYKTEVSMTGTIPGPSIRVGIMTLSGDLERPCGDDAHGYAYCADGKKINSGIAQAYGDVFGYDMISNVVIGIALDLDNHKLWFSKNGIWQDSGDPEAGTNPAYSNLPTMVFFPAGSPAGNSVISC